MSSGSGKTLDNQSSSSRKQHAFVGIFFVRVSIPNGKVELHTAARIQFFGLDDCLLHIKNSSGRPRERQRLKSRSGAEFVQDGGCHVVDCKTIIGFVILSKGVSKKVFSESLELIDSTVSRYVRQRSLLLLMISVCNLRNEIIDP
jgi:hypothetical protein